MQESSGAIGTQCCAPVVPGYRLLTFPDGTKAGVMGLSPIFEDMYRAGKAADRETASEIVERLSEKNYIAPSARSQYEDAVLNEYARLVEGRPPQDSPTIAKSPEAKRRLTGPTTGFMARVLKFFGG